MIQFNLLPDVKMQFLRAQRLKRLLISISALVTIITVVIFVFLLLFVDVAQKKHLTDINTSIETSSRQLTSNGNLNKILTIQNQLNVLPQLQAQTPAASRLFKYLTQLTPTTASISSLQADFSQDTLSLTGSADSLDTINKFVDSLKFTTYTISGSTAGTKPAFSTVVLSTFGYTNNSTNGQPATFTITFNFDPLIFNNTDNVNLTVPQITSTRSIIGQPTSLFVKGATSSTTTSSGGH